MGPPKAKEGNQHIYVAVRCRPMSTQEAAERCFSVVDVNNDKKSISIKERLGVSVPTKTFTFDRVFGSMSKQMEIYKAVVEPAIEEVIMGYNCTIFAYGQTGTGKTFTMEGERSAEHLRWEDDPMAGIIPRSLAHLFEKLELMECDFTMRVSYLELYNEELFDLLGATECDSRLRIYDDTTKKGSVVIQGLEEVVVRNKHEVYNILQKGSQRRQTAATMMNATSSRSHTVFTVTIHTRENSVDGEELVKTGKLNLVDLAGSENIGRSGAVDKRAREAGNINQSLLTLGRVITALVEHAPHVPYRESKLTRILQDSLGGRTKTSIIATISPASSNLEETLSTLDYAHRAKNITNRPEINQKLTKKALIKEYNDEIERLRKDLQASRDKNGIYLNEENYKEMQIQLASQASLLKEHDDNFNQLSQDHAKLLEENSAIKEELADVKFNLEETSDKLEQTEKTLELTRTRLIKTRQQKEEQSHLVSEHVKNEALLQKEAKDLLSTVTQTTGDIDRLQNALDRINALDKGNLMTLDTFCTSFTKRMVDLKKDVEMYGESQKTNADRLTKLLTDTTEQHKTQAAVSTELIESLNSDVQTKLHTLLSQLEAVFSRSDAATNSISQQCGATQEKSQSLIGSFRKICSEVLQNKLQTYLADSLRQVQLICHECQHTCSNVKEKQEEFKGQLLESLATGAEQVHSFVKDVHNQLGAMQHTVTSDLNQQAEIDKSQDEKINQIQELLAQIKQSQNERQTCRNATATQVSAIADSLLRSADTYLDQQDKMKDTLTQHEVSLQSAVSQVHQVATSNISCQQSQFEDSNGKFKDQIISLNSEAEEHCTSVQSLVSNHQSAVHGLVEKLQADLKSHYGSVNQSVELTLAEINSKKDDVIKSIGSTDMSVSSQISEVISDCSKSSEQTCQFVIKSTESLSGRVTEVETLVHTEIQKDKPSGTTPQRHEYQHPKQVSNTLVHKNLLEKFRQETLEQQVNLAANLDLPDDDDEEIKSEDGVFPLENEQNSIEKGDDPECSIESSEASDTSKVSTVSMSDSKENMPSDVKPDMTMVTQRRGKIPKSAASTNNADLKQKSTDFRKPTTPSSKTKMSTRQATSKLPSVNKRKLPDASPGLSRKHLKPTN